MRIAVACDHAGFPLKQTILDTVLSDGYECIDLGAFNAESSDYPDFAAKIGRAIHRGEADRGILICGSGVGASIAANKIKGIYACLCHDTYSAHQGVEHDNMNVLCLGAKIVGPALAQELVHAFLGAIFVREERYLRRLEKVRRFETGDLIDEG
jgi:ribose 5-phosphate isomerase B